MKKVPELGYHLPTDVDALMRQIREMQELQLWIYQQTSDALMVPALRPREARAARDQAINDINKRLGGIVK